MHKYENDHVDTEPVHKWHTSDNNNYDNVQDTSDKRHEYDQVQHFSNALQYPSWGGRGGGPAPTVQSVENGQGNGVSRQYPRLSEHGETHYVNLTR